MLHLSHCDSFTKSDQKNESQVVAPFHTEWQQTVGIIDDFLKRWTCLRGYCQATVWYLLQPCMGRDHTWFGDRSLIHLTFSYDSIFGHCSVRCRRGVSSWILPQDLWHPAMRMLAPSTVMCLHRAGQDKAHRSLGLTSLLLSNSDSLLKCAPLICHEVHCWVIAFPLLEAKRIRMRVWGFNISTQTTNSPQIRAVYRFTLRTDFVQETRNRKWGAPGHMTIGERRLR